MFACGNNFHSNNSLRQVRITLLNHEVCMEMSQIPELGASNFILNSNSKIGKNIYKI